MKEADFVQQQHELVQADASHSKKEEDDFCETGLYVRAILKFVNLDFIYVFKQGVPDVEKLKASLERVLGYYPILAGRTADKNRIHLNNHGAIFRVQQCKLSLQETIMLQADPLPNDYIASLCYIPIPRDQVQGKAPLLTVTVTLFQDGGWTLGVVMNHIVGDGWSFAMFMKDWSLVYNTGKCEDVQYHLPASFLQGSNNWEADAKLADVVPCSSWLKRMFLKVLFQKVLPYDIARGPDPRIGKPPYDRFILHFSKDQLQRIKAKAEQTSRTWISTNEALLAHVWKLFLTAAQLTPEQQSCVGVSVVVDLREKLPGILSSHHWVGNIVSAITVAGIDMTAEDAAQQIHDTLRVQLQPERVAATHRLENSLWADNSPFLLMENKAPPGEVRFGSTPGCLSTWNAQTRHPYYEIDFGTGKPTRGFLWNWNQPITVLPSCCGNDDGGGGGVDIYIDMTDRGPVSWKRHPKKWSTISILSGVVSLTGGWLMLRRSSGYNNNNNVTFGLVWLASFGLLSIGANSLSKQEIAKSKQSFREYCEQHYDDGI